MLERHQARKKVSRIPSRTITACSAQPMTGRAMCITLRSLRVKHDSSQMGLLFRAPRQIMSSRIKVSRSNWTALRRTLRRTLPPMGGPLRVPLKTRSHKSRKTGRGWLRRRVMPGISRSGTRSRTGLQVSICRATPTIATASTTVGLGNAGAAERIRRTNRGRRIAAQHRHAGATRSIAA